MSTRRDPTIGIGRPRRAAVPVRATRSRPSWSVTLSLIVVLVATLTACSAEQLSTGDRPWDGLRAAIEAGRAAHTARIRGSFGASAPVVRWEGFIAGADESYQKLAMGVLIEERRIDDTAWSRPLDGSRSWISTRSSEAFDLGALLLGKITTSQTIQDQQRLQLRVSNQDVFRALTHIPSAGDTEVTVAIISGFITDVTLRLGGRTTARIELWDYGAPLFVERPGTESAL